jgi:nucleotide-binding universal stress UspA family protein
MYKKIGVAIAFSPRCEAIMGEASRLQKLFGAVLVLIHVGEVQPNEEAYMEELIDTTGVDRDKVKIMWEKGNPARKIISVAKKEKIDLLIAGALQRENVVKFYFGSIARKLIRKSACSLPDADQPSQPGKSFQAHCNQRNGRR